MVIKQVAAIRRKPGLTHDEFSAYVRDVHGKLAAAEPLGVKRYVQNHVFDSAYGCSSDAAYAGIAGRDLVTELWFADEAAMIGTFRDPYVQTTIRPDGANFNDFSTAVSAVAREVPLESGRATAADAKIFYFLKLTAGHSQAPQDLLRAAHAAGRVATGALDSFAECVANVPVAGSANSQHFGGQATTAYDAIIILRVTRPNVAAAFRPYLAAFEDACGNAVDRSLSFFFYTEEAIIFETV